jgi:hypothetical protein
VRAALLLLLLLNLAFFAWAQWLTPREPALPVSPRVEAPLLQLASEARAVSTTTARDRCVTVGPFASAELAARARTTLADSGYASMPREEETRSVEGYWVFLEAPTTPVAERRLLERLRRGGIRDAAAIGEGDARRISLGIFNEEARAIAQSERVARLQLLPQIEAREQTGTTIWLDLQLKSDAPPLEGQKFPAGDAELEFRPCPPPSGATPAAVPDATGAESNPAQ